MSGGRWQLGSSGRSRGRWNMTVLSLAPAETVHPGVVEVPRVHPSLHSTLPSASAGAGPSGTARGETVSRLQVVDDRSV